MPLTNGGRQRVANWLGANATTAPDPPFHARLCKTVPTASAAGTESSVASRPAVDFLDATSIGEIFNNALFRFDAVEAATFVGVELYDEVNFRWAYHVFPTSRVHEVSGDSLEVAAGEFGIRIGASS